jgi:hypothetical protein
MIVTGNKMIHNKISQGLQLAVGAALVLGAPTGVQAKPKKNKIINVQKNKVPAIRATYRVVSAPILSAPPPALERTSIPNSAPRQEMMPPPPSPPPPAGLVEPSDYVLQVKVSADSKIMFVAGYLGTGAYMKINRVLNANPDVKTLYLESSGGVVFEGLLISNVIKAKKINTYVESFCASACTMAFIAGADRAASPNARIGFHSSYKILPYASAFAPKEPSTVGNAVLRAAYGKAGLEAEFINKVMATSSETMWYPTVAELKAARVITRKSSGKELELPENMGRQRIEIEKALLAQPLWQAAAKQDRKLYDQIVDDAWIGVTSRGNTPQQAINGAQYMLTTKLFTRIAEFEDDVLADYAILFAQKIDADMKAYNYCYSSLYSPSVSVAPLPAEVSEKEKALLIKMLETPAGKPLLSSDEAAVISTDFSADLILRGVLNQYDLISKKCPSMQKIFQEVANLPKSERAKTTRAIIGWPATF